MNRKQKRLFVCEFRIRAACPDSAFDGFSSLGLNFTVTGRPERNNLTVKAYCDSMKEAKETLSLAKSSREMLKTCEIRILRSKIVVLQQEDWTEKWKRHFKVMRMGRRIVIKPSWLKHKIRANDLVIEIDPGMSFGTGKHDTTRFCLEEIERARKTKIGQSFLDAGCGSGILSIAAAKLGYNPVICFDNDPEAVKTTFENFERNNISAKAVNLSLENAKPLGKFDIVAANIISGALIKNSSILRNLVKTGGALILAGITNSDAKAVIKAFKGLRLSRKKSSGGWTGLTLQKIKKGPQLSQDREVNKKS
ncbi:MAG TPA: 50S ribosomal protein L11 methyltransferase [Victivallales bacterium]|nr:50S ribosomal protein L11 methyltransferase [Victivallales bacterium]